MPPRSGTPRYSSGSVQPIVPSLNPPTRANLSLRGRRQSVLEPGKFAWNTPEAMTLGESKLVEVRVTLDAGRFSGLESRLTAAGAASSGEAAFGRILVAKLESAAFNISPKEGVRQHTVDGRDTVWRWAIEPKTPGDHELLLTIESVMDPAGVFESTTRQIKVRAVPVPVPQPDRSTAITDFVVKNWDKLWTLLLLPIAGGAWAYVKRRRAAAAAKPFPLINTPP